MTAETGACSWAPRTPDGASEQLWRPQELVVRSCPLTKEARGQRGQMAPYVHPVSREPAFKFSQSNCKGHPLSMMLPGARRHIPVPTGSPLCQESQNLPLLSALLHHGLEGHSTHFFIFHHWPNPIPVALAAPDAGQSQATLR